MYSGTPQLQHLSLVIRPIKCDKLQQTQANMNIQDPVCLYDLLLAGQSLSGIIYKAHSIQPMCNPIWLPCGLHANTSHTERTWRGAQGLFKSVCAFACVSFFACVFVCSPRQVSTLGVAEEDEAPDTGGAADDQAHGQHGAVRHLPAQPAHKEEAQDDLHPAQAVHQAVAQLAEAEVALRQRCHHGLGIFRKMLARSIS